MEGDVRYYIPEPDEIRLGLEYEMREWVNTLKGPKEEWVKKEWTIYDCLADIMILFEYSDIRIKHIMDSDFKDLGFEKIDGDIITFVLGDFKLQRLSIDKFRISAFDSFEMILTLSNKYELTRLINQLF